MPSNVARGMPRTMGVDIIESNSRTKATKSKIDNGVAGRSMMFGRCLRVLPMLIERAFGGVASSHSSEHGRLCGTLEVCDGGLDAAGVPQAQSHTAHRTHLPQDQDSKISSLGRGLRKKSCRRLLSLRSLRYAPANGKDGRRCSGFSAECQAMRLKESWK